MLADEIIAEIAKHPKLRDALQELDDMRRDIARPHLDQRRRR